MSKGTRDLRLVLQAAPLPGLRTVCRGVNGCSSLGKAACQHSAPRAPAGDRGRARRNAMRTGRASCNQHCHRA